MLGWFTAASWAIKLAIVGVILAAFIGFGWLVYNTLYHWGYDEAVTELTPQITKANLERDNALKDADSAVAINKAYQEELGRLDGVVREQKKSIDAYQEAEATAQIKLRAELTKIVTKENRYKAEIRSLQAIVDGPARVEGACHEADAILRELMRDRLRDPA